MHNREGVENLVPRLCFVFHEPKAAEEFCNEARYEDQSQQDQNAGNADAETGAQQPCQREAVSKTVAEGRERAAKLILVVTLVAAEKTVRV
eukprot:COSAG05_NODE_141_length_16655_cov_22.580963_10_plen_91_part_00